MVARLEAIESWMPTLAAQTAAVAIVAADAADAVVVVVVVVENVVAVVEAAFEAAFVVEAIRTEWLPHLGPAAAAVEARRLAK